MNNLLFNAKICYKIHTMRFSFDLTIYISLFCFHADFNPFLYLTLKDMMLVHLSSNYFIFPKVWMYFLNYWNVIQFDLNPYFVFNQKRIPSSFLMTYPQQMLILFPFFSWYYINHHISLYMICIIKYLYFYCCQ